MSLDGLVKPSRLFGRAEVLATPCPVPARPGVYGWFFREVPDARIDAAGCVRHDGLALLYVGIAPGPPPKNGRAPSKQSLRSRVRYHYRGKAIAHMHKNASVVDQDSLYTITWHTPPAAAHGSLRFCVTLRNRTPGAPIRNYTSCAHIQLASRTH
jgi:hypothetical protein